MEISLYSEEIDKVSERIENIAIQCGRNMRDTLNQLDLKIEGLVRQISVPETLMETNMNILRMHGMNFIN